MLRGQYMPPADTPADADGVHKHGSGANCWPRIISEGTPVVPIALVVSEWNDLKMQNVNCRPSPIIDGRYHLVERSNKNQLRTGAHSVKSICRNGNDLSMFFFNKGTFQNVLADFFREGGTPPPP